MCSLLEKYLIELPDKAIMRILELLTVHDVMNLSMTSMTLCRVISESDESKNE